MVTGLGARIEQPERDISFGLVERVASNIEQTQESLEELSGDELARLFSYKVADTRKQRELRDIEKMLSESDYELEEINLYASGDFADYRSVAQAVWNEELEGEEFAELREQVSEIRGEVIGSEPSVQMVARTANAILLAGSRPRQPGNPVISGDGDSDTNAALKRLLVSLILGMGLRASVAALDDRDAIDENMVNPDGLVWLEPLPALQQLLGKCSHSEGGRWIPLEMGWSILEALIAACQLMLRTDYPDRSNLYQILASEHPGKLLRRIEQKQGQTIRSDIERIRKVFSLTNPKMLIE